MTHHSLDLIDRSARDGVRHRHRWHATCTCGGWQGVPTRRRRESEDQYHHHVNSADNQDRLSRRARARRRRGPEPRPVTPAEDLPEELR